MTWLKALPNLLTGARIALGVLVFALLAAARLTVALGGLRAFVLLAFAAFVVAAATDFFDGWLARKLSAQSDWGAMLDPIADKIAVLAAVLGLVWLAPRLSVAIPGFLILMRELFVSGLREAGGARGLKFPVTQLAKWKTTIQLIALSAQILAAGGLLGSVLTAVANGLLWIAALMTLWTGLDYARAAAAQL
jgi:CDP-diacylglycerol--glycerol-3-phosphate 3-phosphatidyltransferase